MSRPSLIVLLLMTLAAAQVTASSEQLPRDLARRVLASVRSHHAFQRVAKAEPQLHRAAPFLSTLPPFSQRSSWSAGVATRNSFLRTFFHSFASPISKDQQKKFANSLLDLPLCRMCRIPSVPAFPMLYPSDQSSIKESVLYPHFYVVLNKFIQQRLPGHDSISAKILQVGLRTEGSKFSDLVLVFGALQHALARDTLPVLADVEIKISFEGTDGILERPVRNTVIQCLELSFRRRNSLREQQIEFESFPHFFLIGDRHGNMFPFRVIVTNDDNEPLKQLTLYMTSETGSGPQDLESCIKEWNTSLQPDLDKWLEDAIAESGKVTTNVKYQAPSRRKVL